MTYKNTIFHLYFAQYNAFLRGLCKSASKNESHLSLSDIVWNCKIVRKEN